ncbi:hypothetical protein JCM13210_13790 [Thermaerobacter litoralis]
MGYDSAHNELMTKFFDFYWDTYARNALLLEWNFGRYYTADIALTNKGQTYLSAWTSGFYTNLPCPVFDVDDDKPVNGYYDETEVVTTCKPDQYINVGQKYSFISYWTVRTVPSSPVAIEWNSQLSVLYYPEYDTYTYEYHHTRYFPWW